MYKHLAEPLPKKKKKKKRNPDRNNEKMVAYLSH
jgi:hypothetical protein